MNRTNNCGELSKTNLNQNVKLSGWVNKVREKGFIIWVDLRDRYGITQLVFDKSKDDWNLEYIEKKSVTSEDSFILNIKKISKKNKKIYK